MIWKSLILLTLLIFNDGFASQNPSKKVILLGLDGLPIYIVKKALSQGHLPFLKSLNKHYKIFEIKSDSPPYSNVIWANYFTGVPPNKHGIEQFYKNLSNDKVQLYESSDLKAPMIWELLDQNNLSTFISGFFAIYPVKEFKHSTVISQRAFYIDEITKYLQKITTSSGNLDTPLKLFWSNLSQNNNFIIRPQVNATFPRQIQKKLLLNCPTKKTKCLGNFKRYFPPVLIEKVGEETPNILDYICSTCEADEIFLNELNKKTPNALTAIHWIFPDVINHSLLDWWPDKDYISFFTDKNPSNKFPFIFKALKHFDNYLAQNIAPHLKENTTLIILSDHGVHSSGHHLINSFSPDKKNGFALIYERGNKASGFSKNEFSEFDLYPFLLNKWNLKKVSRPNYLKGHPVCLKLSEKEKNLNYKAIIIVKDDFTFKEWLAKDYNPLTLLPSNPDKQGKVKIQGSKLKIFFKNGDIKEGSILKFRENSIIPTKFEVYIGNNIKKIFGKEFCLL